MSDTADKKQYVGDKEVASVDVIKDLTPLGREIVKVTFTDKSYIAMTKLAFDRVSTDAPLVDDPSGVGSVLAQVRERKVTPVIKEILALMTEGGLTLDEIDPTISRVIQSVNWNTEQASNLLWGVGHSGERSLLSTDSIIKGNGPREY